MFTYYCIFYSCTVGDLQTKIDGLEKTNSKLQEEVCNLLKLRTEQPTFESNGVTGILRSSGWSCAGDGRSATSGLRTAALRRATRVGSLSGVPAHAPPSLSRPPYIRSGRRPLTPPTAVFVCFLTRESQYRDWVEEEG